MKYHVSARGPQLGGTGAGKVYRGSRKRLMRIKWQHHMSVEFWIFVLIILFMLIVGVPWMIEHTPPEHHDITTSK